MGIVIPQVENNPLSGLSYAMIGKGKKLHLSSRNDETLCGKYVDLSYVDVEDAGDTDICARCYKSAEKRYAMARKIAYGAMRDAELDRMTYGGQHYSAEEEAREIAEYLPGALAMGDQPDTGIMILTPNGPVAGTETTIREAIESVTREPEGKWDAVLALTSSAGFHTVPESVDWHIFNGEEWMNISYTGYAPVNHWDGEKWHAVEYRHRADECNSGCPLSDGGFTESGTVHYGESRSACGEYSPDYDGITTTIDFIECAECIRVINTPTDTPTLDWFCDMHGDMSSRCQGVDHSDVSA